MVMEQIYAHRIRQSLFECLNCGFSFFLKFPISYFDFVGAVMETAQYGYGADLRSSDKKRLEKKLKADSDHIINKSDDLPIT